MSQLCWQKGKRPKDIECVAPGNKWRITDTRDTLSGKYIGDDTLCVLEAEQEAGTLDVSIVVAKSDLEMSVLEQGVVPLLRWKMMKIIIAKALSVNPETGYIKISHSHTDWSFD